MCQGVKMALTKEGQAVWKECGRAVHIPEKWYSVTTGRCEECVQSDFLSIFQRHCEISSSTEPDTKEAYRPNRPSLHKRYVILVLVLCLAYWQCYGIVRPIQFYGFMIRSVAGVFYPIVLGLFVPVQAKERKGERSRLSNKEVLSSGHRQATDISLIEYASYCTLMTLQFFSHSQRRNVWYPILNILHSQTLAPCSISYGGDAALPDISVLTLRLKDIVNILYRIQNVVRLEYVGPLDHPVVAHEVDEVPASAECRSRDWRK